MIKQQYGVVVVAVVVVVVVVVVVDSVYGVDIINNTVASRRTTNNTKLGEAHSLFSEGKRMSVSVSMREDYYGLAADRIDRRP